MEKVIEGDLEKPKDDLGSVMDRPISNLHFRIMALVFRLREIFRPPSGNLKEAGIGPGMSVLDYGCGPGGFSMAAAGLVGEAGKVYALDIQPLAVQSIKRRAAGAGLKNVQMIKSDCATGIEDEGIDVALLYDIFHDLGEPDKVLRELHRVLKPNGLLSFSDHHLDEEKIVTGVTGEGLFRLASKGRLTYSFLKI
jgi:ubiquinone/menaquinone biosynthesis C-methylase UbiE